MDDALSMAATALKIGLAPDTFRKRRRELVRANGFPAPIDNGCPRFPKWRPEAVQAWLDRRAAALGGDGKLQREAPAPGGCFPANDDARAHRAASQRRGASAARINSDRGAARALMQKGL